MKSWLFVVSVVLLSGCRTWSETKAPCTYYDRADCGKEVLINAE